LKLDFKIPINPRLAVCAEFATGEKFADIGTDHAYLPCYLVSTGRVQSAIATDISPGSLKKAGQTVLKFDLQNKIELRLGNGLCGFKSEDAGDICIAGMGGLLISQIIENAFAFCKNSSKRFILSPMSHYYELRKFLFGNGFDILTEKCAKHGARIYSCLFVQYTGKICVPPPVRLYFGSHIGGTDALGIEFVQKNLAVLRYEAEKLSRSKRGPQQQKAREIFEVIESINGGKTKSRVADCAALR
jgi:tRNA (adenine22-N1)-methyltransferase